MKSLVILAAFGVAAISAEYAAAQAPAASTNKPAVRSYQGEIVMTKDGRLAPPWKEHKACIGKTAQCQMAVYNSQTREVARYGDQWSTRFEATGNGQEIQRRETSMARAVRLSGAAPAPR